MRNLSEKQKLITGIVSVIALIGILTCAIVGMVKDIKEKEKTKEASIESIEENTIQVEGFGEGGEEIDITELEEPKPEEDITKVVINENKTTSNNSNGGSKSNVNNSSYNTTYNTTSTKTYYIKVNYGANVVTIYTKDSNGQYTVPVKAMVCSTGTATPRSGTYSIKLRWEWLGLFGGVYGHYSTQITGNILFHSVPYLRRDDPASLEYWEYDKLRNIMLYGVCKAYRC